MREREREHKYHPQAGLQRFEKLGKLDIEETWSWDQSRQLLFGSRENRGPTEGVISSSDCSAGTRSKVSQLATQGSFYYPLASGEAGLLPQHWETHRCHLRLQCTWAHAGAAMAGCTPGPEPPSTLACSELWSLLLMVSLSRAPGPSPSLSLSWLLYLPACPPPPPGPLFLPSCIHVTLSHSNYGKAE